MEAGAYAPSAHNEQSWHFTVIRNKELLDRISAKTKEVMAAQTADWKPIEVPGEWVMQGCRDVGEYRQAIDKYMAERTAAPVPRTLH